MSRPPVDIRYNFDNVDEYLSTAVELTAQGRYGEAALVLREAVARHPDVAAAHHDLGCALLTTAARDKAKAELWEDRADEEIVLEEAVSEFQAAIDLAPRLLLAINNLGRALAMQGRAEDAAGVWNHSLSLEPDQPDLREDLELVQTQLSAPRDEDDGEPTARRLEDTGLDDSSPTGSGFSIVTPVEPAE